MSQRVFKSPKKPVSLDDLLPSDPYAQTMGIAPEELPSGVRISHQSPLSANGIVQVTRHRNPIVNLITQLFGLPKAGTDVKVLLIVTSEKRGLSWFRLFGKQPMFTHHRIVSDEVWESTGVMTMRFRLHWLGDRLEYQQVGFRILGIPIPGKIAPETCATVKPVNAEPEAWQVQVTIKAPLFGVVCAYGGKMWRQ